MESWERELIAARIISGMTQCKVQDAEGRMRTILIRQPSRLDIYSAWEHYREILHEATEHGLPTEQDMLMFLYEHDLWDDKRQSLLDKLPKEIEDFKVELFQCSFKEQGLSVIRSALKKAKEKLLTVLSERHARDHETCTGIAVLAKNRYVLARSMFTRSGKQIYSGWGFLDRCSSLLDNTMIWMSQNRILESHIRELAHTDPWRGIWAIRKSERSLFGGDIVDLTDDQKNLVAWSNIYDNATQHHEKPSEEVLSDDDRFDGWMIVQKRQREANEHKEAFEKTVTNEKIRNSQEVYVMASNADDIRRIRDMNDPEALAIRNHRFQVLNEKGKMTEMDMPDTRQRYRIAVASKLRATVKGN